ncbi:MAG TPA: hypothetical protein DDX92_14055 [Flavobacteriales bacterium]|jgi:hypothetical protein|nr:hypothetical protein [Flavobacteriales bacterium]
MAGSNLYAQSSFEAGTLPSVNLNTRISGPWRFNFKWESRQVLYRGIFGENKQWDAFYERSDFSGVFSRKVGLNNSIAAGYLIRFVEDRIVHRTIQQFTLVQYFTGFRLAHRFSTDQTFIPDIPTISRYRYRISVENPLNGQEVDPKEFYLKVNNEYLFIHSKRNNGLEIRIVPVLGYNFSDRNKLEAGIDYRLAGLINSEIRTHDYWLTIGWYVKL